MAEKRVRLAVAVVSETWEIPATDLRRRRWDSASIETTLTSITISVNEIGRDRYLAAPLNLLSTAKFKARTGIIRRFKPIIQAISLATISHVAVYPIPLPPTGHITLMGKPLKGQRIVQGGLYSVDFAIEGERLVDIAGFTNVEVRFSLATVAGIEFLIKSSNLGSVFVDSILDVPLAIEGRSRKILSGAVALFPNDTKRSLPEEEVRYKLMVVDPILARNDVVIGDDGKTLSGAIVLYQV